MKSVKEYLKNLLIKKLAPDYLKTKEKIKELRREIEVLTSDEFTSEKEAIWMRYKMLRELDTALWNSGQGIGIKLKGIYPVLNLPSEF